MNTIEELQAKIVAMQEYAAEARLRENRAEDARVHLSFELEKARAQIAAMQAEEWTLIATKDKALREAKAALTGLVAVAEAFLPLCEKRSPLHRAVATARATLADTGGAK